MQIKATDLEKALLEVKNPSEVKMPGEPPADKAGLR
jgi:hypothetical protein